MSELYNRIERLCKEKQITITQMCKESGASRGSLGDLSKGRIQSLSTNTMHKIADYFDVTVDYLNGKTQYRNNDEVLGYAWGPNIPGFDAPVDFISLLEPLLKEHGLSKSDVYNTFLHNDEDNWFGFEQPITYEEAEMICDYLGTNVSQVLFDNFLYEADVPEEYHNKVREWENLKNKTKKEIIPSNISEIIPNSKIYQIPIYESVSAGFGAYADDCVIDFLPMVIENPYDVPDTIAIKVSGDSMYPKIEDGDLIVVRKQESVDSGDVAVMLLDGEEGLVKKVIYGNTWIELHSFNPEYKTRRFDDEEVLRLRVVGKVLKVVKTL